ncbi:methyl-accepting chemotaxis protein [Clostridiisalibacter paucivorans]|uniref:methyl-accepting chemotaxis protein n=1 Tax=Clostridiisalibacter paucivorans TaxID=408753 RepID=UPI00047974C8|nr:methyl-accepting chemotaxis protein [Clostridiisalibacter paucivorans]
MDNRNNIKAYKKEVKGKVVIKLTIIITLVAIIPLFLLGISSYMKIGDVLEDKLEVTTGQMMDEVNEYLSMFLNGIEQKTSLVADNSSFINLKDGDVEGANIALELLSEVQKNDDMILNSFFGQVSGTMDIYPQQKLSEDYDPRTREWYQEAIKNPGKVIWTSPYRDAATGKITMTAAKVVKNQEDIIGVVGIDVMLNNFSESVSNKLVGHEGYVIISTDDGIYISHPDGELIGKEAMSEKMYWNDVKSTNKGFNSYEHNNDNMFIIHRTNDRVGWKLIGVLHESELIKDTGIIKKFVISILIGTSILAFLISIMIARGISKPLNIITEGMKKVANGDFTTNIDLNTNNEFEIAGNNFNRMVHSVSLLVNEVKNASKTVMDSSSLLADITDQTTTATNEVATTIEEIAKGSNEQAKDTEQGVIKVNELASNIDKVNKSTDEMTNMSTDTYELSHSGLDIVKVLTERTDKNMNSVTQINDIVFEMNESSQNIGKIIDAISDIAEQTNLLALNAAIEAARAGESGRGFAVVAEEIRKLAEESANSANEIKDIIEGIQQQSDHAVVSMKETKRYVQEQGEAVKDTENVFNKISDTIFKLVDKVTEVREYTKDIDNRKNDIVQVIDNISAASEETSASTEEVSASAEEQLAAIEEVDSYAKDLKELSKKLQKSVEKFKIDLNKID